MAFERKFFSGLPGFTVQRKEPAYNSLSVRLGQLEKAAETTQSTVGKALLNREEVWFNDRALACHCQALDSILSPEPLPIKALCGG